MFFTEAQSAVVWRIVHTAEMRVAEGIHFPGLRLHFRGQLYKRQISARGDDPGKTQGMSETLLATLIVSSVHLAYECPSCPFVWWCSAVPLGHRARTADARLLLIWPYYFYLMPHDYSIFTNKTHWPGKSCDAASVPWLENTSKHCLEKYIQFC